MCHVTLMLKVNGIKHKGLKLLATRGDVSKINPAWRKKVKRVLAALNIVCHPSEMDLPGYEFHELKGNKKGTYSVLISKYQRVTFKWEKSEGYPYDVNLEDYDG